MKNTIKKYKEESKIKLSQVLEGSEITKPILETLESVYNPLINEIVEKYDDQLRKNGQYLTAEERRRLKGQLKEDMIIKLNLSINLTKKKMETWEIYPNSDKQTELNFEEEGESSEQVEQLKEEAQQLKEGILYEVAGLNQGEGEDLPGDPEGLGEDQGPEPQILESILDREDLPEYKKRKAKYLKKEAAAEAPLQ